MDARLLGKPPRFDGGESAWPDWSFQLRAYVETIDEEMGTHMDLVESQPDQILLQSKLSDTGKVNSKRLYYVLAMLLGGWL